MQSRSLLAVYFFAAWGNRMWEFSVIVFLMELFRDTLLPPSIFGLFENVAGIALGTTVGDFIDTSSRLTSMRVSIVGQNVAVMGASALFSWALSNPDRLTPEMKLAVFGCIVIAGMVAKVSLSMNKICVHKVWAVAMADGDSEVQAKVNSELRRVDLICNILAPLAVGVLSAWWSSSVTCALISIWGFGSLFTEWYLSLWFYNTVPSLATLSSNRRVLNEENCCARQISNLAKFRHHPAFWASVPYCMLYMSALSFGGIMVSFLTTLGVSTVYLAAGRGIAAFCAIGATFAVPKMIKERGLVATGKRTIWAQVGCLAPLACGFIMFPSRSEQQNWMFIAMIFVTVCASRFGLWGFDLAQTQMMQVLVEKKEAGVVNGAQETLTNACWLGSFVITMVFHDPTQFIGPVLVSFSVIFTAALIFSSKSLFLNGFVEDSEANMCDEDCVHEDAELDLNDACIV